MQTTTNTAWDDFARSVLARHDETLLRSIAAKLFKPRSQWPTDELIERAIETFTNPPVIDRRIRELPESARQLLATLARARQPRWSVGQLLAIAACLGHQEGLAPIITLLDTGFLLADLAPTQPTIRQWEDWLGVLPMTARIVLHPAVGERAVKESTGLPTLDGKKFEPKTIRVGDGLEWFLRAGVLWQQLRGSVMRFTQARMLFKRDLQRLQTDALLSTGITESPIKGLDLGVLTLEVAIGMGVMTIENGELRTAGFPSTWDVSLPTAIQDIWRGVSLLHSWDPEQGYIPAEDSPTGTVAMLAMMLLANQAPGVWTHPAEMGAYLFPKHPLWASRVSDASDDGVSWLEALFFGWALPSRLVEAAEDGEGWWFRLTDVGRWVLAGGPEPKLDVPFHQGLVVQPNADMIAYRQTLTPGLIGKLSRLAEWKMLGPACTLGITADSVYRGLESNLSLAEILGTLQKHSAHGMPSNVADLIRQWAGQRERISVYTSSTLMEFNTAAELETAISRGLVTIRLTDRIGLAEGEIDYKQIKQVGNRDYESPPQKCVVFDDDGVTFTVDISSSDLLLEAELARLAEQLPSTDGTRRYRITPASAKTVREQGLTLPDFEQWCVNRGGEPLSPAARLLFCGSNGVPSRSRTLLVIEFPSEEVADGVRQWPETAALVGERLGPMAMTIEPANLEALKEKLAPIGVLIDVV